MSLTTHGRPHPAVQARTLLVVMGMLLALLPVATAAASPARPADPKRDQAKAAAQTLTWTADDSVTEYATVTTEAAAGAATIVFENSEATGNTTGMQHTLTFDTVAPGYNHDVDLNLMAYPSDANGGVATADVTLTEGKYLFKCVIPGHGTMKGELVVTGGGGGEDTTPPTVTAMLHGEQDADGNYIDTAEVMLAATDNEGGSGVAGIEYNLDDAGYEPYGDPFPVTALGAHTVSFRATDNEGNVSEVGTETFTVVDGDGGGDDTTPPTVTAMLHGEQDADGAYIGNAEVMLSAADNEGGSGVASIEYNLDDAGYTAYADPFTVAEVGAHTVTFRATDEAGNVSEVGTETFTVVAGEEDTEAPAVTAAVSGNLNGSWEYVGPATVTLTATDEGSGVASTEYSLDDGDFTAYADPVVVEDPGSHTVKFRATDNAGNVSEVGQTTFIIAEDAGNVTCTNPDPSPTVVMGDAGSGVRNRVADGGTCTIDDLIQDERHWASHANFVNHAKSVVAGLLEEGVVSGAERTAIVSAAQRSDVGR